jgi:hypothetical protein
VVAGAAVVVGAFVVVVVGFAVVLVAAVAPGTNVAVARPVIARPAINFFCMLGWLPSWRGITAVVEVTLLQT